MAQGRHLNYDKKHDIFFHLNPSLEKTLQPRDIIKHEGIFEKYNDQLINLIKDPHTGINYKNRDFSKLSPKEMEELERFELFHEIKNNLRNISGIQSEGGFADGFVVNVYHPGVGFREHSDRTLTELYFPCEDNQDFCNAEDNIYAEASAITAAVCFGTSRTVMFKYDTDRATISRPEYYPIYFEDERKRSYPLYPIGLNLNGGDYYAFSRGFSFNYLGELTIKGINSTHKHCVLAHPKYGIENEDEQIHVSFVMFGCTSADNYGNGM